MGRERLANYRMAVDLSGDISIDLESVKPLPEACILKIGRTFQIHKLNSLRDHCCPSNIDGFVRKQAKYNSEMVPSFLSSGVVGI